MATAEGSVRGTRARGAPANVSENAPDAEPPVVSVACAVNPKAAAAVGTPETVPALLRSRPGGSEPASTVHE